MNFTPASSPMSRGRFVNDFSRDYTPVPLFPRPSASLDARVMKARCVKLEKVSDVPWISNEAREKKGGG